MERKIEVAPCKASILGIARGRSDCRILQAAAISLIHVICTASICIHNIACRAIRTKEVSIRRAECDIPTIPRVPVCWCGKKPIWGYQNLRCSRGTVELGQVRHNRQISSRGAVSRLPICGASRAIKPGRAVQTRVSVRCTTRPSTIRTLNGKPLSAVISCWAVGDTHERCIRTGDGRIDG